MEERREPLRGIQRKVAQTMTSSHAIPRVTTIREVRMDKVKAARERYKEQTGRSASYLAFVAYGVLKGMREYPVFNAHLEEDCVVYPAEIGISIAISIGDNLVTPVLCVKEDDSFAAVAEGLAELIDKARGGKLSLADYKGGTFTISNSGALGGEIFTPLINYPQSAILGIGKMKKKVILDDQNDDTSIIVCPMMYLCLTYDHRIINGSQAVKMLGVIDDYFQNPQID